MKFEINQNLIIGMVHCLPLVNTKDYKNNNDEILKRAIEDAVTLEKAGVGAIMVENMGDNPLKETLDHEQAIQLAVITKAIKDVVKIPVGIDAAFNDYKTSLAIAKAVGGAFVRIPVYVGYCSLPWWYLISKSSRSYKIQKKKFKQKMF